jgi:hypothetical protein
VVVGVATFIFVSYLEYLSPTMLVIHGDATHWRSVTVDGGYEGDPQVFERPGDVVTRSPLEHGEYSVTVRFADGKVLYLSYFHTDAGIRRRVDVYIQHTPGGDYAYVRCVEHHVPYVSIGSTVTPFDAIVNVAMTSVHRPVVLDTI